MFIKITCSNGFCGCDEEFFEEVENVEEADEVAVEYLNNEYSFSDPDDRFCETEDEESIEDYYENLTVWWEEISEEEFNGENT